MKNRIKKFYKEHENAVHVVTVFATFALTAAVIYKVAERGEIEDVAKYVQDDGSVLVRVVQKNGTTKFFTWPA